MTEKSTKIEKKFYSKWIQWTKRNIYIIDHICRDFIIYVDPLFKPVVLFQDMNREQENLSRTLDTETTDDFSQLLSNSLATVTIMVCIII